MKRFHVHVAVPDLDASIAFYSRLFGSDPTVRKTDYAKWMIDEPRVNFAISQRSTGFGVNHLGLQADDAAELDELRVAFERADAAQTTAETDVACCYARSNKHWVTDPQGIAWEAFHSFDTVPLYESACTTPDGSTTAEASRAGCCGQDAGKRVEASCC